MSLLPLNPDLQSASRLRAVTSPAANAGLRDWLCLIGAGLVAAAASTFLNVSLRIPGHAILRAVFPMAVGLALAPRRGGGTVMGATALLTAAGFRFSGFAGAGLSLGALTSLAAVGPLLDWSLRRAQDGPRRYLGFALAGLTANLLALAVRGTAKALTWEHLGAKPLSLWLPTASVTYVGCGLVAGLLSGAVLFQTHRPQEPQNQDEPP